MNQSGDVKLDASIEYRTRLSGSSEERFCGCGQHLDLARLQRPAGRKFEFNKFYKQIAVAYGLGLLRLIWTLSCALTVV